VIDRSSAADPAEADFVTFQSTGEQARGEYRCAECGYGIAILSALPVCPMCAGTTWEEAVRSSFGRADRLL
jgi:rubrerythrin